ncbi:MAG TPA: DinB family protein [Vicinamibacterales bacterium]
MLEMLRDLVAHKGHANAALLTAIRQNGAAASDPELLHLLHHILLANRFWLLTVLGQPFVLDDEARPSPSFDALVQRYSSTQAREAEWLETASEGGLAWILEDARIPGGKCSVSQALMQVCMHSHGHRAQCAKLLRRHGGLPPATDFILWLASRPRPEWPGASGGHPTS